MKTLYKSIALSGLASLFLSGCGTLDGNSEASNGSTGESPASAFSEGDPRILARAGGTDIGLTQRSTAADGTVVFHAEAPLLPEDQNVHEDIYLKTPDGELTRITRAYTGAETNNASLYPCISDDGNIVAYCSRSNNLVPGDTNDDWDVFVYNRTTGATSLVSVDNSGVQGERGSLLPSLSADGTRVTFVSRATLTPEKTSTSRQDVFVRDLSTGTTTLVSHDGAGGSGNSHSYDPVLSGDGSKIAYASRASNLVPDDTNGRQDIFLYDVLSGVTQRVTDGNSHSYWPSVSTDGSKLAFTSYAGNLVPDDINAKADIFFWDGAITALTQGDDHAGRVVIDGAGTKVAFDSLAENLTLDGNNQRDIFTAAFSDVGGTLQRVTDGVAQGDSASMDWGGGHLSLVSANSLQTVPLSPPSGEEPPPDGSPPAHADLISRAPDNAPSNGNSFVPAASHDGRFVAFSSYAENLVPGDNNGEEDIFRYDRNTGQIILISHSHTGGPANGGSQSPVISSTGDYIAFASLADNLVEDDSNFSYDVFVWDASTGDIERVSQTGNGVAGEGRSWEPSISDDGRFVAFSSYAGNLEASVTGMGLNTRESILLYDRDLDELELISNNPWLGPADASSVNPSVSGDGRYVVYESLATNLIDTEVGENAGIWDIYLFDRTEGTTRRVSRAYNGGFADGDSHHAVVDGGGQTVKVAFESEATNLVTGDDNLFKDIFVYTLHTFNGSTSETLVSVVPESPLGDSSWSTLSQSGQFLAFTHPASIFIVDLISLEFREVTEWQGGFHPDLSGDGSTLTFGSYATQGVAEDTNGWADIFLCDNPLAD